MKRTSHRDGFTPVDLLTILVVLVMLVTLLIPWISKAREEARRKTCVNNLKQVGLGFLNHESATKRFPPSCHVKRDPATGKITSMDGWSWCVSGPMGANHMYDDAKSCASFGDQRRG